MEKNYCYLEFDIKDIKAYSVYGNIKVDQTEVNFLFNFHLLNIKS
ncbi:MAG: hypothetical protein ACOCRK_10000 [bacterium]